MRWLIAVAIVAMPACFRPVYERPACSTEGACPAGLACVAGFCERPALDAAVGGDTAPIDVELPARTRAGLIALWEFDESSGTTINDTSDTTNKVPLRVSLGDVVFADGTMTMPPMPDPQVVIQSEVSDPHINDDVNVSEAVTLEAWVKPTLTVQGSMLQPIVVAGLSANGSNRNIALLQAGTRWLARVRSWVQIGGEGENTIYGAGLPELVSTRLATAGVMTHLVIVCDATRRTLYIDGAVDEVDPSPGSPAQWGDYRMQLGNEPGNPSSWAGTFALVAMYNRALPPAQIDGNYRAGANWKPPD